jgi:signal transduction histidine kinase
MLQAERDALNQRHQKMIDEAERACARLLAIVEEMNDVGKLDADRIRFQDETFDVFSLMRRVAGQVDEAADRGVRLVVDGETDGAPLRGDRARLAVVFATLLRAVLREQRDAGEVAVSLRRRPDASTLIVIAREPDVEAAIAAPAATFDELRGGLGLALPYGRRIIERHRGRIWSPAGADGTASARSAILVSLPIASNVEPEARLKPEA